MDDRELRKRGTEVIRLIPEDLVLNESLDAVLEQRADECGKVGHVWADAETRRLCAHCGASWDPDSN